MNMGKKKVSETKMPSLRGRMVKIMLQHRHLFQFKLRQELVDWNKYESILKFRQEVEDGAGKFGKMPGKIIVTPVEIDQLDAEWISPGQAPLDRVILYFHGGGYVTGTCHSHRAITAKFVKAADTPALLFEYRLAPENPYPAALEDAVTAYRYLLEQEIKPSKIVFVGDSAGGGLCLATLLAIKDRKMPFPAAAVAYSPITDFTCSGESHQTKKNVCLSPLGMAPALAKHYAGDQDLTLPTISPLYGDLKGLPPLLIYAGEDETLRDDAVRFGEKAQAAGVDITMHIGKGMFHCYPATAPLFPEATKAFNEICAFVQKMLQE